jgi:hypothetical protein
MLDPSPEFIADAARPLGWFYLVAAAANVAAAWRAWRVRRRTVHALAWSLVAAGLAMLAARSLAGHPPILPQAVRAALDHMVTPMSLWLGSFGLLAAFFWGRRCLAAPAVAWTALNAALLLLGMSLADRPFAAVAMAPDNVPIVGMIFLLGFFLWLATAQAVRNDRRLLRNLPPVEQAGSRRVLVWPDLVYVELIAMVAISTLLVAWSFSVRAPLEQPANPALTPNPAKAPWYFLGLQELLVFSDAWLVGVLVPCAALVGLMAIPYLDFNPQGSGYYTIRQRRFATAVFLFGFFMLWILPILIGTFLRGPNWSAFGPYEIRDPGKLAATRNVPLSEFFWTSLLGRQLPRIPEGGLLGRLGMIAWREIAGLVLAAAYFLVLPPLLGRTVFCGFRRRMGRGRYVLMVLLFELPGEHSGMVVELLIGIFQACPPTIALFTTSNAFTRPSRPRPSRCWQRAFGRFWPMRGGRGNSINRPSTSRSTVRWRRDRAGSRGSNRSNCPTCPWPDRAVRWAAPTAARRVTKGSSSRPIPTRANRTAAIRGWTCSSARRVRIPCRGSAARSAMKGRGVRPISFGPRTRPTTWSSRPAGSGSTDGFGMPIGTFPCCPPGSFRAVV